jgi:hypothetical protein
MAETKNLLIQKRQKLLKEIEGRGDFIKANVRAITKAGQPTSGYHLTYKDDNQKTRSKYVSKNQIKKIERAIKNMKRVKELLNKISELNIEIALFD